MLGVQGKGHSVQKVSVETDGWTHGRTEAIANASVITRQCEGYTNMAAVTDEIWYYKLEYLAVYGRASAAAFRQLSTHGQKFDPKSLYEPI